ncbi:MAG: hypothetical protein KC438_09105 [Thermomicrobiales bacterium]|nr:hypothetical protein [Thermomicrobiales bacterium]
MIRERRVAPVVAAIARAAWIVARWVAMIFGRGLRTRNGIIMTLAVLIVLSAWTRAVPALSALLSYVAVLILAGVGFWFIATAPFRRRR